MKKYLLLPLVATFCCASPCSHENDKHTGHGTVISMGEVKIFKNNGNSIQGIATPGKGAEEMEVWKSSVAPGKSSSLHSHDSEEIFVIFKGEGEILIGDETIKFKAPAVLIAPAHLKHQFKNTGKEPTDHIVIIRANSKIYDAKQNLLSLPWRK
jgi:quercetin dioxygenase-like cupin family protein